MTLTRSRAALIFHLRSSRKSFDSHTISSSTRSQLVLWRGGSGIAGRRSADHIRCACSSCTRATTSASRAALAASSAMSTRAPSSGNELAAAPAETPFACAGGSGATKGDPGATPSADDASDARDESLRPEEVLSCTRVGVAIAVAFAAASSVDDALAAALTAPGDPGGTGDVALPALCLATCCWNRMLMGVWPAGVAVSFLRPRMRTVNGDEPSGAKPAEAALESGVEDGAGEWKSAGWGDGGATSSGAAGSKSSMLPPALRNASSFCSISRYELSASRRWIACTSGSTMPAVEVSDDEDDTPCCSSPSSRGSLERRSSSWLNLRFWPSNTGDTPGAPWTMTNRQQRNRARSLNANRTR